MLIGYDNNDDGDIADAGDDVQVADVFSSNAITLSYDDNGNLTADGLLGYVYDGWNRLVEVQRSAAGDTTTVATYAYDGRTRRVSKVITNNGTSGTPNDGGNATIHFYYDNKWRILETRDGSSQATRQWVWGTKYTDEILFMDVNGDPTESNDCDPDAQGGESTYDRRYFYHQDRNWNVVALSEYGDGVGTDARLIERYAYTPYGQFIVLRGDSGSGELANALHASSVGNPFTHQGLGFDHEKGSYQNRYREYMVALNRFDKRDPYALMMPGNVPSGRFKYQYADGANLYAYQQDAPMYRTDPKGLCCCGNLNMTAYGGGLFSHCVKIHNPKGHCVGTISFEDPALPGLPAYYAYEVDLEATKDFDFCEHCDHACSFIIIPIIIPITKHIQECGWIDADLDLPWEAGGAHGTGCVDLECTLTSGWISVWDCCEWKPGERPPEDEGVSHD